MGADSPCLVERLVHILDMLERWPRLVQEASGSDFTEVEGTAWFLCGCGVDSETGEVVVQCPEHRGWHRALTSVRSAVGGIGCSSC